MKSDPSTTADFMNDFGIDSPDETRVHRLRVVLAVATLLMVGLSWPLWIDLADFPTIPLVRWYPSYGRARAPIGLAVLVLSLGMSTSKRFGRAGLMVSAMAFVALILGDQLRFQPWVYQYIVIALLLSVTPPRIALTLCRLYLASVYFHSGLSKLDAPFVTEMGPLFLRTIARVLGLDASSLIGPRMMRAVLMMPIAEIMISVLLLFRRTRAVGYVGLVVLHLTLFLILGPWGLGHSTIVLVWNLALIVEEYLVFWPLRESDVSPIVWTARAKIVGGAVGLLAIFPLVERWGLIDSWPAHALYASHCERSRITIEGYDSTDMPDALRRHCFTTSVPSERSVDLTGWCREVRGVPPCPQNRYANGVAEWLGSRFGTIDARMGTIPTNEVAIDRMRRAEPFRGARLSNRASGLESIRDDGDLFWFNAHPRSTSP